MLRFQMSASVLAAVAAVGLVGGSPLSAAEYVVDQRNPAASDEGPGSAAKPFKTISKAVAALQPGDRVLIKAGVYRENVVVKAAGTAEKPIVIEGAPGERAVISGGEELKGWKKVTKEEARGNPNWEHIYVVELDKAPSGLFQNGQAFLASRWPNFERLPAEGGTKDTVIDAKNLTQPAGQWEGGTLAVRVDRIGSYFRGPITKYDAQKHELTATVQKPRTGDIVPEKDTYWIEAAVAAIAEPGEYALDARATPVKVYIWPQKEASPDQQPVETRRRGTFCVTWGPEAAYLTFRNLEVCYSTGSGFGADEKTAKGAHDITIDYCVGHHNVRGGCALDGQRKVTIRRSLFCRNNFGVVTGRSKDVTVEETYLLGNDEDGLVFSWGSQDVRFLRGVSEDHWYDAHPDNFQIYRDVTNLTIDSCLFFNGGQGFMLEEANDARITNNMIVGTRIKGVILGGNQTVTNFQFEHNTLAFTGLQPVSSNGPKLVLKNNVILPGADRQQVGVRNATSVVDYNLFYKPALTREDKWGAPNTNSKYDAPKFRCAPPSLKSYIIQQWGAGAKEKLAKNTPGRFFLDEKPVTDHFAVGDWVEVNYDGVPRKVTEVTADSVAFDPPIRRVHHWWSDTIVNWRSRKDFAWDLRLADGSPGKGMAEGGKDAGANLDVQAYLTGDFNGDGKRDVPPLPENYDRRR
jgi:hypothetical protein